MIKSFLSRIIILWPKQIPLRIILVVPFILQICLAVALTGWFSLRNGSQSVDRLVSQLQEEVNDRIEQHLENYLLMPELANQEVTNVFDLNLVSPNNISELERFFWQQIISNPRIDTIQFGTETGEYIGAGYWLDRQVVIKKSNRETNQEFRTYYTDENGKLTDLINSYPNYDPRKRPWYEKAKEKNQPLWSPIYVMQSHGRLGITLSKPIYNDQNQLLGILGTDILLSNIGEFLQGLHISETGQAFILETSGNLIASSNDTPLSYIHQGKTQIIKAENSSDRLINLTTEYLREEFDNIEKIDTITRFKEDIKGEKYFLQIAPFKDDQGLDWLIVIVIPQRDFMGKIQSNTITTITLCIIALIVASTIGLITSSWVTAPIRQLSSAAKSLSEGKWDPTMPNTASEPSALIKEVRQLSLAFHEMKKQLQKYFYDLQKAKLDLENRVKERTNALQEANHNLRSEIVERQRMEGALRSSETKFRNLFENSQVGLFRTKLKDGLFIDANQYCAEILGYNSTEEIIGKLTADCVYVAPEIRKQVLIEIEKKGEVNNFEAEFYRKDNSVVWVLFSGRLNKIDQCLEGVITDISDRKQAEAALQEKEQYLRLIINNIPQQVFWKDRNLVFLGCNKNWANAALIEDPDSVIGKTDFDLLPEPKVAEFFRKLDQKIIDEDKPQLHLIAKKQRPAPDGSDIWLDINKIPIHDAQGNVIGILGVLDDITERKLAQEALHAEQQKSEELLLNILPKLIADQLKEDPSEHIAEQFDNVTILFADIVGFTNLSGQLSPRELVDVLNEIFSTFDQFLENHGLEKIKTIGDAYMVVGGLPVSKKDHAQAIANMALEMIEAIKKLKDHPLLQEINQKYNCPELKMRIGINTGSVIAGVIGTKKFIYDLWGDTVNVASRMESQGEPGKIQITQATYTQLKDDYILEERGLIEIKGKGKMLTYWLLGKK
jgi:PAS domain S-box-containing protein